MSKELEKIWIGTWGISDSWGTSSNLGYTKNLLNYCFKHGLRKFDTAKVYGGGKCEGIFNIFSDKSTILSTKIPALTKPNQRIDFLPFKEYYSANHIEKILHESYVQTGFKRIDTIFLHNWHRSWNNDIFEILRPIVEYKKKGLLVNIGISLPDNYEGELVPFLKYIDVVMMKHNILDESFLDNNYKKLLEHNVKIIVRSIFESGIFFKVINGEMIPINDSRYIRCELLKEKFIKKIFTLFGREITSEYLFEYTINRYLLDKRIHGVVIGVNSKKQVDFLLSKI